MKKEFTILCLLFSFLIGTSVFVSAENLITCTDSDEGINYYKQGTVNVDIVSWNESNHPLDPPSQKDYCHSNGTTENSSFVREWYCETQSSAIDNNLMKKVDSKCPFICQDGRCAIPPAPPVPAPKPSVYSCTDSDGGLNYEESGHVIIKLIEWDTRYTQSILEEEQGFDSCGEINCEGKQECEKFSRTLRESYCINATVTIPQGESYGRIYKYVEYECPSNAPECQNGVCVGRPLELPPKLKEITPDAETGPLEIPKENKEEYKCNGCQLEDKCFPFGYRKDRNFCSEDEKFVSQQESGNTCENNFECKSNVCVSSQCVSGGLLQKILNWFKRLFGAD